MGALYVKNGRLYFGDIFGPVVVFIFLLLFPNPSLTAQDAQPWMDKSLTPRQRADRLLSAMTPDEKHVMVHGTGFGTYGGVTPGNSRLGIPTLNLQDGPIGVGAGMTKVTAFPSPTMVASSWDPQLMLQYSSAMATEEKGKGANAHLAPMMNIIRVPQAGRNFESYGEDPFLSSRMAEASVRGIQSQGIIATAKHYLVNEQESDRNSMSSDVDARTIHEIYLPPFKAAVKAGVGSIMCSYNKINGVHACENALALNNWLKGELGFDGWVMSDWAATHSTVSAALNGLDMEQPNPDFFGALPQAIAEGLVPQSRLDDMVRRILLPMFRVGLFDNSPSGSPDADVQTPAHAQLARDVAAQGMVLLKNQNALLPIDAKNIQSIAVIGSAANSAPIIVGGGSGSVVPSYLVTALEGIRKRAGKEITIRHAQEDGGAGIPIPNEYLTQANGDAGLQGEYYSNPTLSGNPAMTRTDSNVDFEYFPAVTSAGLGSKNWSARWTGALKAPQDGDYTFFLTSDDGSRLYINGNLVVDNWGDHSTQTRSGSFRFIAGQSYNIEVQYYQNSGGSAVHLAWRTPGSSPYSAVTEAAQKSDLAVVVVGLISAEAGDRGNLSLPAHQDELISQVAAANPRTIVVAYTPAQILMPWANEAQVILFGGMPGQEAGHALASLLFGDVNPSGKLAMTIAQRSEDYPANTEAQFPGINLHSVYSEGLLVGYRHFDAKTIEPLYPFGHGLSYTTYSYSDLTISREALSSTESVDVSVKVTNTGNRAGEEVVQLYLGFPSESAEPPKQLKGFAKLALEPGESRIVKFTVSPELYSFWSAGSESWQVQPGTYQVMVGASSRDIRQSGSFQVGGGALDGTVYQAEEASLAAGAHINNDHSGYVGSAFVDGFLSVGASTSFAVQAPSNGAYRVSLRYANAGVPRTLSVYVNGNKVRQTVLPTLANWDMWDYKAESLKLNAGSNTIMYRYDDGDSGQVNLDSITVNQKPDLAF